MLTSLIVGGFGMIGLLACCGIGGWVASTMVPVVTKVPAEITSMGRQILNMDIPEDFSPDNALTMDNMLFVMRIAEFHQKEGKGEMMIGVVKLKVGDPGQTEDLARQHRSKFEKQFSDTLDMRKTETHDITINGQKVAVSIGEATDRSTEKVVHTASAEFDQPTGRTFFLIRMDDDIWNEEAVLKMLEETKAQ